MLFLTITQHYLSWHYTQGLRELLHLYRNFWWFVNRLFSIPELFSSLFSPFRRMTETKRERWSFEDLAGRMVINTLSRLIGATIRLVLLTIGLLTLAGVSTIAFILIATWFIAPALIVLGILYGLTLMVRF